MELSDAAVRLDELADELAAASCAEIFAAAVHGRHDDLMLLCDVSARILWDFDLLSTEYRPRMANAAQHAAWVADLREMAQACRQFAASECAAEGMRWLLAWMEAGQPARWTDSRAAFGQVG
jgi:hypothetical protein